MDIVPFAGSKPALSHELQLFELPRTEMGIKEKRFQDISPLSNSLSPMEFLVQATDTFVDLSRSYFKMELRLKQSDNTDIDANDNIFPTINLPHTMIKQCSIKWNGTLLNPQTDTYSIRAYLATLMNYSPEEGNSLLAGDGWFPTDPVTGFTPLDAPAVLTANKLNSTGAQPAGNTQANIQAYVNAALLENKTGHNDYNALSDEQKAFILASKREKVKFEGGKWHTLFFKPMHEVFYAHRLMPPGIEQRFEFTFQPAKYYLNGVGFVARDLHPDDIKMKYYMCLVTVHPTLYRQITSARHTNRNNVNMATIRSECRVFTLPADIVEFNEDNLFQNRIPQRVVVGLLHPNALNGDYTYHPFAFQKFGVESVRQVIRGEDYPYRTLELNHNNSEKDMNGYHRFLQAGGFYSRLGASMVTPGMWGGNCTLFVFDNTASGNIDGPHLNPKQKGNVRLIIKLGANVNHPISIVIYAQFEGVLHADPNGAILYDVYD